MPAPEMLIWALDKAQKQIQYEREVKQRKYGIKANTSGLSHLNLRIKMF
jgi:hypothetical protein